MTRGRKKGKKKKTEYYVDPDRLKQLLAEYYESNNISDELAESIVKLATGLSYRPNFINYTFKEDMIGDAVVKMLQAVRKKKYKIDSPTNPFSYYTTIAFHEFINRIKKEGRNKQAIADYQEMHYPELMNDQSATIYVPPEEN